jgi:hypothetical protein
VTTKPAHPELVEGLFFFASFKREWQGFDKLSLDGSFLFAVLS